MSSMKIIAHCSTVSKWGRDAMQLCSCLNQISADNGDSATAYSSLVPYHGSNEFMSDNNPESGDGDVNKYSYEFSEVSSFVKDYASKLIKKRLASRASESRSESDLNVTGVRTIWQWIQSEVECIRSHLLLIDSISNRGAHELSASAKEWANNVEFELAGLLADIKSILIRGEKRFENLVETVSDRRENSRFIADFHFDSVTKVQFKERFALVATEIEKTIETILGTSNEG